MSPIGYKPPRAFAKGKGIALIEILVALVVLTAGLIIVYQPLLGAVTALDDALKRLEARRFAAGKIWQFQEDSFREGRFKAKPPQGVLMGVKTPFEYETRSTALTPEEELYELEFMISWRTGHVMRRVKRTTYISVPHAETG